MRERAKAAAEGGSSIWEGGGGLQSSIALCAHVKRESLPSLSLSPFLVLALRVCPVPAALGSSRVLVVACDAFNFFANLNCIKHEILC